MKQIIRNNVFETNSSSMHSLVVQKDIKDIEDINKINTKIIAGEYSTYYDELDTSEKILSYLWTGLYGSAGEDKLKSLFPNVEFIPFDKGVDGYIDHQSHDLPFVIIEQSDEDIYNAVKNGIMYIEHDGGYNRCYSIKDNEIIYDAWGVHEKDDQSDFIPY